MIVQPDADMVTHRLSDAGRVLFMLPDTGHGKTLRASSWEKLGLPERPTGLPMLRCVPLARDVTLMDEAMGWLSLIPRDRQVLRRIVAARCLVSPLTERHLFSWRRLGTLLGADHKAVIRWHALGIDLIVAALRGRQAA